MKRTAATRSGGQRRFRHMILLALPAAVVLAQESANATIAAANQTAPSIETGMNNFTVAAKYQPDSGTLFYDKLDKQGHIVERIEKFYPLPPKSECNQTTYGAFLKSLQDKSIAPLQKLDLTETTDLKCCDFYSEGLGYQFTVCDKGVGVYILGDRVGGQLDHQYLNMPA